MRVKWEDNFEELYKKRGQQKYGIRLLALWKIQSGLTEAAVCQFLGKTPNTIRSWRKLYEKGGLEELLSLHPGRGRKARLPNTELIKKDIELLQESRSGGRTKCRDVVDMISKKYDVYYSQSGMYHVLHRLGFSWITARSKHPKKDFLVQEDFKKKFHP